MKLTRAQVVELVDILVHYANYSGDVPDIQNAKKALLAHDAVGRELPMHKSGINETAALRARVKELEAELLTAARIIRSLVPITDITADDLAWADQQLERLNKEKGVNHD